MRSNLPISAALVVAALLAACGGGGGDTATAPVPAARTLAALAAKDVPAQWPTGFKAVTLRMADLVSATELAQTTQGLEAIFVQVWYLDQDRERQPLAFLSLAALERLGGSLTLPQVPGGVMSLHAEVYTAQGGAQQTLASREFAA